jgi:hypothetical protein
MLRHNPLNVPGVDRLMSFWGATSLTALAAITTAATFTTSRFGVVFVVAVAIVSGLVGRRELSAANLALL